jgi:phage-related protein
LLLTAVNGGVRRNNLGDHAFFWIAESAPVPPRLDIYDKFAILRAMISKGRTPPGAKEEPGAPLSRPERPLVWMGSTKRDISELPKPVRASFGYRLGRIQVGLPVADAKALAEFGTGVYELREAFATNAYRMMYVVKLKKAVYVLHVFMKKSKSGIGLPQADTRLIRARLQRAEAMDAEDDNA